MATPILTINAVGGTKQWRRIVNGADTPFGATFAAAGDNTNDSRFWIPAQRACQLAGTQTFFGIVGNRVYRTTDGGATTVAVSADLASIAAPPVGIGGTSAYGAYPHSVFGPYVVYINGTPRVWFVFQATNTIWRFGYSDDLGATWTYPQVSTGVTGDCLTAYPAVPWRGAIHGACWFPRSFVADPVSLTVGVAVRDTLVANGSAQILAQAVVNDRMIAVWPDSNGFGNRLRLWEFAGGAWTQILTVDATRNYSLAAVNNYGGICFVHPTTGNLWVGAYNNTGGPAPVRGIKLFEVDLSTGVVTEWSTSLPAAMQSTGNQPRIACWLDGMANPDSVPDIYVAFQATIGLPTNFTTYSVAIGGTPHASAPVFTSIGTTQSNELPFPWYPLLGGDAGWTSGQRNVLPISRTQVPGGHRYGFKLYSPNASPDLVKVQILYGTAAEENAANVGTIAKPAGETWTLQGGPGTWYADGLDAADPGAPTFFVDWLCQTDSIGPGDRPKMRFKVYT